MKPETRTRALRAAAKLAAVSVASCSTPPPAPPATATVDVPPVETAEPASPVAEPVSPDTKDDAETKIDSPQAGESKSVAACRAKVGKLVESAKAGKLDEGSQAEFEACCQTLAEFHSMPAGDQSAFEARNTCCNALQWQGSIACTPWGPPMPPAMPFFLREIA